MSDITVFRRATIESALDDMERVRDAATSAMQRLRDTTAPDDPAPADVSWGDVQPGEVVIVPPEFRMSSMRAPAAESAPAMPDPFLAEFKRLILVEGGYANNPLDSGGATRYGVTAHVARANGYTGAMQALPLDVAERIYRAQYWDLQHLDAVHALAPSIASELFDTGVNAGIGTSGRMLQRTLNVLNALATHWPDLTVDGVVGPVTVHALGAYLARRGVDAEPVLFAALNGLQVEHYVGLAERRPKDQAFTWGWLRTRIARAVVPVS